jgi:hypothetical protein
MRETRTSGLEGGGHELNRASLPLWFQKIDLRASVPPWPVIAGLLRFDVDPALQLFALPAA